MKKLRFITIAILTSLISPIGAQTPSCLRADTLMSEFKYPEALSEYLSVYGNNIGGMESINAMNAAIAAAQCDKDSLAVKLVAHALDSDSTFFDERISVTELLEDCRLLPEWDALQNESERRLADARPDYDIPLRKTLLEIYHTDQNPRGHLMMMFHSEPTNK